MIKNMKQYMSMEALLPRCSAEHRELSTIRPKLIRTQSNRPELSLSIQQLYSQWSPSLKPERSGFASPLLFRNIAGRINASPTASRLTYFIITENFGDLPPSQAMVPPPPSRRVWLRYSVDMREAYNRVADPKRFAIAKYITSL